MLGSGIYVLKIPTHRHSRYVPHHVELHPEWIACASIKRERKTSSNHSVYPTQTAPSSTL